MPIGNAFYPQNEWSVTDNDGVTHRIFSETYEKYNTACRGSVFKTEEQKHLEHHHNYERVNCMGCLGRTP